MTVSLEYAPGKLIFGLDEPGYLLANKKSSNIKAKGSRASIKVEELGEITVGSVDLSQAAQA